MIACSIHLSSHIDEQSLAYLYLWTLSSCVISRVSCERLKSKSVHADGSSISYLNIRECEVAISRNEQTASLLKEFIE